MKIIDEGDRRRAAPWWTKVPWKCAACGFTAELDTTDAHRIKTFDGWRGGKSASMTCPTCGSLISVWPASHKTDQWGR